jgi:hypothetical protein
VKSMKVVITQVINRACEETESAFLSLIHSSELVHSQTGSIPALKRLAAYNSGRRIFQTIL